MLFNYANVVIFTLVGVGFIFVTLCLCSLIRPHVPMLEKLSTYECGEEAVGSAWMNFNIRFYVVALVFVVFDVEVALMFPVARIFREWIERGDGLIALIEIFAFIFILLVGFVYAWSKGDLDWMKKVARQMQGEGRKKAA